MSKALDKMFKNFPPRCGQATFSLERAKCYQRAIR